MYIHYKTNTSDFYINLHMLFKNSCYIHTINSTHKNKWKHIKLLRNKLTIHHKMYINKK